MTVDHLHHNDRGSDGGLCHRGQKTHHAQGNHRLCGQAEKVGGVSTHGGADCQGRGKNTPGNTGKISHEGGEKTCDGRVPRQAGIGGNDMGGDAVTAAE